MYLIPVNQLYSSLIYSFIHLSYHSVHVDSETTTHSHFLQPWHKRYPVHGDSIGQLKKFSLFHKSQVLATNFLCSLCHTATLGPWTIAKSYFFLNYLTNLSITKDLMWETSFVYSPYSSSPTFISVDTTTRSIRNLTYTFSWELITLLDIKNLFKTKFFTQQLLINCSAFIIRHYITI